MINYFSLYTSLINHFKCILNISFNEGFNKEKGKRVGVGFSVLIRFINGLVFYFNDFYVDFIVCF